MMAYHMRQVVNKNSSKSKKTYKPKSSVKRYYGRHKLPGTSKLEEKFAKEFLQKLGVKFIYQFKVEEIGRWYDFYLPEHNLIIEIDGSYYHADPRVVSEDKLTPMHKHNMRVDEYKNRWALAHGIPIVRIWEKDINDSPSRVLDELKVVLGLQEKKTILIENKNKRHTNKIK